jgi:4-hydroxybenzoate polyprenyltransferase
LMRSAGCIVNDMWDRDFDAHISRTKGRPLANRQLGLKDALCLLALLLILGFWVLIQFNLTTLMIGCACVSLTLLYPLMKRLTYWPQFFLGLTFNAGALMGWASQGKSLNSTCFFLYGACVLWTLGYDTIYALQDVEGDALMGLKSSAVLLKEHVKRFLWGVYGLSFFLFYQFGQGLKDTFYYRGASILIGLHFIWQITTLKITNPADCLEKFKSNFWVGGLLFLGLALDCLFR